MNSAALEALDRTISQKEFAEIVGLSEARVSQIVKEGTLTRGDTGAEWIAGYCEQLREVAAGRAPAAGELDPAQEKAALDREKRMGQRIKNLRDLGEYAPIALLTRVLASATAAVSAKLDALPGELLKVVPDLPDEAITALRGAIARARNDWVSDTEDLQVRGELEEDDEDEEPPEDEGAD
ncbi:hypothetical protein [Variovorax sp. IB41]|uniref:hypothetical protein n=1 Tax=Variovorax sp. IB41 TaxID=2779370 RepID=UPI0018E90330|nr:hypothetical protein [Variovorax sp. IB41]MBJ2155275.1 hypothetical protein [Variovorax sp. IB41]